MELPESTHIRRLKEIIAQQDNRIKNIMTEKTEMTNMVQTLHGRLLEAENTRKILQEKVDSKESMRENLEFLKVETNDLYKKNENLRKNLEEKDIEMQNKVEEILRGKESMRENLEFLKVERNDLYKRNENLKKNLDEKHLEMQSKIEEILNSKESMRENLEFLKNERNDLYKKIENLRKNLEENDFEIKKNEAETNGNIKLIIKALNKYESMEEFEDLIKLILDLVDFHDKIESVVKSNYDFLQINHEDPEIERIKQKNAELYGQLNNSNVKTFVMEKSAELKVAERELNTKREFARHEFSKVNNKLMIIKNEMSQDTKMFAKSFKNTMEKLKKELYTHRNKLTELERANKNIRESISYVTIKNILLQQQNALMHEMITTNTANTSNYFSNSQIPRFCKDSSTNHNDIGNPDNSNEENNDSIFDDDVTETYKLILLNVDEKGNKSDTVKVQKVLRELTNLNLDDVDVKRMGKSTGKARPIVVRFDSNDYVQEILNNSFLLKNSKFSIIEVCSYDKYEFFDLF